ncbi:MAG: UDP-glucose/GDP-mannose dehydrogenase family protein, partial [Acidobacteria bacterium]|nr:UDP-glucose/GDP-mannose dehydrogenase family protein [Acidobacteriota bacterium]
MHHAVYGTGYLATVISSCLADFGLPVTCFHEDHAKISTLARDETPYYEKNLKEVVRRNVRSGRLTFSHDNERTCRKSAMVFLAEDGHDNVEESALRLAKFCSDQHLLLISTPVPVGTASRIEHKLRNSGSKLTVVSHPVFVTDGCAVEDFNWPDRILLGTESQSAVQTIKMLYRPLVMRGVPVVVTNHETAELAREASTAFLATKISFINELATLCEHVKADAVDLALALGLDKKIAPRCLQPGTSFGGPFVDREMDSLAQLASNNGVSLKILSAAREVNHGLCDRIFSKLSTALQSVQGKQVGLLGLAFKPNSNSVAASTSLQLAKQLVSMGAHVRAYDPAALEGARAELNGSVRYCETPYAAAEGVDALVLGTAWSEFRSLDFDRIKRALRRPLIVDTKNILDAVRMRALGFEYVG